MTGFIVTVGRIARARIPQDFLCGIKYDQFITDSGGAR